MARRPGMAALAQAAGVSVATVDRILNGREAVSPATRAQVLEAARRLSHPASDRLGSTQTLLPTLRFGILLHKSGQEFYRELAQEIHKTFASVPGCWPELHLEFASSQAPSEIAALLRKMGANCDVIAATAVNHPEITSAVEDLKSKGIPVFSLLSDFAQGVRAGYLGQNNLKVGRVAAWMIGLAAQGPGKVAIFVGGTRWHGHDLRETGLRAYLREVRPDLEVLSALVNFETRKLTFDTTLTLLAQHPDLRGIYVAGGGMEGAIAALQQARLPGEVVLVVNELTPESRAALASGWVTLVNATPLPDLCRALSSQMARAALGDPAPHGTQQFLPVQLHLRESI